MAVSPQTHPGVLSSTVFIAAIDGVRRPKRSNTKTAATIKTTMLRLAITCSPIIEFVRFSQKST
jgi:hypothetical protein